MNNAVETKHLTFNIEGRSILDDISFGLPEAQIASILGPSGCGKTTLLRCIAGFEQQQKGEIWVNGVRASNPSHNLPVEQREIGMVFQDYALFPHLTVTENIVFGLQNRKSFPVQQRTEELVELFSLQEHVHKYPHRLSGGQQQRVALARALAPRPRVLLLDEPFASLDIELREQLAIELRTILKQDGVTTIMVSHNQLEAFAMADVIGVMKAGRLLQWDTAFNLYHEPHNEDVADLIGEGVFIHGKVISATDVNTEIGVITSHVPHEFDMGTEVDVLIRPDDIQHDDDSPMRATVIDKAFRGASFLYTLKSASGARMLSLVPSHHNHPVNEPIGIRLDIDHLVLFPRRPGRELD
ncbi:MAG: ABC transporter ATP-binding protein [Gammaproteobacteria bacterium]